MLHFFAPRKLHMCGIQLSFNYNFFEVVGVLHLEHLIVKRIIYMHSISMMRTIYNLIIEDHSSMIRISPLLNEDHPPKITPPW